MTASLGTRSRITAVTLLCLVLVGSLLRCAVPAEAGHAASRLDSEVRGRMATIADLCERASFARADSLALGLLAEVEAAYGSQSLETADVLDLVVMVRSKAELPDGTRSRELAERAVSIREALEGSDHPDVAGSLYGLGRILYVMEDPQGAAAVYERAMAIAEKALGPEDPEVARIEVQLARSLNYVQNYAEAEPHFERALAIQEKTLGPDDLETGKTLRWFGYYHYMTRDLKTARAMGERALTIHEKHLPENHLDMANCLNDLACTLTLQAEYQRATELYERALAIRMALQGPEHADVGATYYNLGEIKLLKGDLDEARRLYERGLAIVEKALGPDHPNVAYGVGEIAKICREQGEYTTAMSMFERCLAICERTFGPENHSVAEIRGMMGSLLLDMGDYAGARTLIEQSLATVERILGPDNAQTAVHRVALARILDRVGDYQGALDNLELALPIYEAVYGPEHPATARALQNLGWQLMKIGDDARAREQFERSLAIDEKVFGPDHIRLTWDLAGLGLLDWKAGDYAAAQAKMERAMLITENARGAEHPDVAYFLQKLAAIGRDTGDYARALEYSSRAVAIQEQVLGPEHPSLAQALYGRALLLADTAEWAAALDNALRAEQISQNHVRVTTRRFAEEEALRYAAVRVSGRDLALTLAESKLGPDARIRAWDAVMQSRAAVLDEIAARHRTVADISRLAEALVTASERLAKLMVRGVGDDTPERYRRLLDEATRQRDQAERALAERSTDFQDNERRARTSIKDAVAGMPSGSALVAFVRYDRYDLKPESPLPAGPRPAPVASYMALVQRKDGPDPIFINLGRATDIEEMVSRWRGEFDPSALMAEVIYRSDTLPLRETVWDPVASHLGGIDRVFLVPDGALNLLSFAALPGVDDGYLVESGPIFHYVSAERDLVQRARAPLRGKGLLALGGSDYGSAAEMARHKQEPSPPVEVAVAAGAPSPYRGQRSGCAEFASVSFPPLPGTAVEADEIVSMWRKTSGTGSDDDVVELLGPGASEAVVKRDAPGKRVLHLATHGFFLGNCASALDAEGSYAGGLTPPNASPPLRGENPLVLSGLALAGANGREAAGPGEEDNILTAQEIATLDLAGVELAVLSACDTGLGETRAGEGVFGLRRAFQVAGARTLVTTLWSVEDQSTRQWMREFYDGWLGRGLEKAQAAREASLSVLGARRQSGKSAHPFYWGAFVAAGDWR